MISYLANLQHFTLKTLASPNLTKRGRGGLAASGKMASEASYRAKRQEGGMG